jgi:hypothetical protein
MMDDQHEHEHEHEHEHLPSRPLLIFNHNPKAGTIGLFSEDIIMAVASTAPRFS